MTSTICRWSWHDHNGSEIHIAVDYPGRTVHARIWRVTVGTVPLYLLDTNIEPNNQYDQDICYRLYGGDIDMRIHQEIMLGIGGVRMLETLDPGAETHRLQHE